LGDATWDCPSCHALYSSDGSYVDLMGEQLVRDDYPQQIAGSAEKLALLEDGHFWFEERARLVASAADRFFPSARNLLDVGCGTGYVLGHIAKRRPGLEISGGDVSGAALVEARQRLPSALLYRMDIENIPFEAEFDVVCCLDVLEHVRDDLAALRNLHRAIRPSGGLLITVPQYPWLWSGHDEQVCHVRRYGGSEILQRISDSGFRISWTTGFVSLLLPAFVMSRRLRLAARPGRRMREMIPPKALNGLFRGVMRFERRLIECGIRFPFGSSRLVVARRQ